MEQSENGPDLKSTLADPNGFQYGARPSDPDLPPPRDPAPSIELPTAACWHVHLELRPEELVALHRLGLTKGGLAWREGMEAWQPLRMSSSGLAGPVEPGAMAASDSMDLPVSATPNEATMPSARSNESFFEEEPLDADDDEITLARDRSNVTVIPSQPPPSSHRPNNVRAISDESDSRSLPGRRAALPATSPLLAAPARPVVAPVSVRPVRTVSSVPPPQGLGPGAGTGSGLSALNDLNAPRAVGLSTTLPSGAPLDTFVPPPPPVPAFAATDASGLASVSRVPGLASAPPPPAVVEPRAPQLTVRSLWIGATGLAALSALVAAIVSGVLTSIRMQAPAPDASNRVAAMQGSPDDGAASGSRQRAPGGLSPIPLEQLPLAGASAAAPKPAPAPDRPKAAPQEDSNDAASRARRGRSATRPPLDTVASRHSVAPAAPARPSPPPVKAPGGPADVREIARAVAQAARAATACGMSPQSGRVAITFSPSGAVRSVQMEEAFAEREVGACVLRAMGRARVTAFSGEPVTVRKSLRW